ncbi:hypothetical protein BGW80DRAFT_1460184 [Lactifluus volemus]|nr:hypothetical protein BGW80DRAFT_1460184 [Lactifluus volemus]
MPADRLPVQEIEVFVDCLGTCPTFLDIMLAQVWGSGPYMDDSDIISDAVEVQVVHWEFWHCAEPSGGDDPEDDQQGFFSAGWGNGHEDAGIEILDVSFVKGQLPLYHLYSRQVTFPVKAILLLCNQWWGMEWEIMSSIPPPEPLDHDQNLTSVPPPHAAKSDLYNNLLLSDSFSPLQLDGGFGTHCCAFSTMVLGVPHMERWS